MKNSMKLNKTKLKKIKGDASYRHFFRKIDNKKNSIIVYATKEKEKNLLIYDAINSLLIENDVLAPKLYKENYKKNFIEIEDFGDDAVFKLLKKKSSNKIDLYKKSIVLLNKIQKIKQKTIKNFNRKNYKIPIYTNDKLFKEAQLFSKWYTKKFISKKKLPALNIKINKQVKFLLSNLKLKNDTLVHRDFHVSNLMRYKNQLGVIDTQDALIGSRVYDLASLIDDVRFRSDNKLKNNIYNYYLSLNKNKINKKNLLNDLEILSVIRNMKVIGIFTRLAARDKKKKYLKLIPYAWKLIELRTKNNAIFNNLKLLLDLNFPRKIRILK